MSFVLVLHTSHRLQQVGPILFCMTLPSVSCEVFDEKISTTVNLDLYRPTMQHHNNDS